MEKICTEHLKRIGAWLPPVFGEVSFDASEFPVTASVIIPVYNRVRTVKDAVESALAQKCDFAYNVIVVDNQRVSMSQKQAVLEAKMLADEGKSATEISQILTYHKDDASIYITVDDLKYLKAGGRINAATAAVGSVLNIKPILSVKDGRIEAVGKARGIKAAQKQILQNLDKDMEEKFHSDNIDDYVIYTAAALPREEAIAWNDKVREHFGAF